MITNSSICKDPGQPPHPLPASCLGRFAQLLFRISSPWVLFHLPIITARLVSHSSINTLFTVLYHFIPTPNWKLWPSTKSHTSSTKTQIHGSIAISTWIILLKHSFPGGQIANRQVKVCETWWQRKMLFIT